MVKLSAYGLGAIGLLLVLGGPYFLKLGNDQTIMANATAVQLGHASNTTATGWNLIVLGIVVAIIGVILTLLKPKRRGRFGR